MTQPWHIRAIKQKKHPHPKIVLFGEICIESGVN